MNVDLIKSYRVEAAHQTPWGGDSERLHGHSYQIEVVVAGECDAELGWLIDYAEIGDHFAAVFDAVDHRLLNDIEGLSDPSTGGLGAWIHAQLSPALPLLKAVHVSTLGMGVFDLQPVLPDSALGLPARLRFGFEAAHALPKLPPDHKCSRMHGHSFSVEVGAPGVEALKPALQRVYDQLDHRCLNDIDGLENPTSEEVSRWIWDQLVADTSGLGVVVVAETCTARCIYHGK